jgi:hypothetical protein
MNDREQGADLFARRTFRSPAQTAAMPDWMQPGRPLNADLLGHSHTPMQRTSNITFGDNVRLRSTPETEALGLAGQVGQVYGETTPSVTGVTVVGQIVGSEIRLDGVPKKWTRSASGDWVKSSDKKPWWRFW